MDELIKDEVQRLCSQLGVEYGDVIGKCRRHDLVMARVIMTKYLIDVFELSTPAVGKALNRDHSTIFHYGKVYENEYKYNPSFRKMADSVMKQG